MKGNLGLSIVLKDTWTCGQEQPGIELATPEQLGEGRGDYRLLLLGVKVCSWLAKQQLRLESGRKREKGG